MRCGKKIGMRVPMRRNSMCGIARSRLSIFFQFIVTENQGIAAAQQHVAHFGVRFEVAKGFLEISVQFLFADAADHATAGAVATVTRAAIRH